MSDQGRRDEISLATPSQTQFGQRHVIAAGNLGVFLNGRPSSIGPIAIKSAAPTASIHATSRLFQALGRSLAIWVIHRRWNVAILSREHSTRKSIVRHEADVFVVG